MSVAAIAATGTHHSKKVPRLSPNAPSVDPFATDYVPSLHTPPGWHKSADGQTVARDEADLTAIFPNGPRVTMRTDSPGLDMRTLRSEAASAQDIARIGDPKATTVDGHAAVSISITESTAGGKTARTTEYVVVHTSHGSAALFILEAPGDFNKVEATLLAIPTLTSR